MPQFILSLLFICGKTVVRNMNTLHSEFSNIYLTASGNLGFADNIPQPLLNILVVLGIIFAAIIFIAGLIYIIKSISGLSGKPAENTSGPVNQANTVNGGTLAEENLVNDSELVAAITAAIVAYMGEDVPSDGLVVRSIRRVNRRWQNA